MNKCNLKTWKQKENSIICNLFLLDDTDKGKSAESLPGSGSSPGKSDNEEENEEESTDVFDDTIESLQRITPPTG